MTEQSNKPGPPDAQPIAKGDASVAPGAASTQTLPKTAPAPQVARKAAAKQKLLIGVLAVAVLAALLMFGVPWVEELLSTISTDDAYVNGHVTFVAPRVAGQISRVLVDDNNRVRKGDLLAALDKEPYRVAVSEQQAAVDIATADLQAAAASVHATEAQARARRWDLQRAVQSVDSQVALLHARVAAVDKSKAALALAQVEFDRARQLVSTAAVSREEYDERQAELTTAAAALTQALAEVYQIRVSLGLPAQPEGGRSLGEVPPDLDETFSSVLEAQAELIQSAAQLGVVHSFNQSPKAMLEQFEKLGDINATFAEITARAPAVKQAEARLEAAKRDLAQAELNLRYCDIRAKIDGVVTRRNINPGDYVQVGQNLMAIRSLDEIWVDANFKETQLRNLRIGQKVDLYVDMYGGTHVFKGRIAGFTMGTGSTLALLPPENATGNFVKVVQRLPVRIDLIGYNADQTPLFVGTSVVPYVYIHKPPTGPDAGKFLQASTPQSPGRGP
ncbi:MAG TPA: HlyD family secretion protein [Acidocella sp.]|uniref:HlyD family secretion protein n=1 Tax=Acidocella sp. TaxID=50710 RepID=UPI002B5B2FC5|nr:HlyD family secretion protein [Acidocella sp.]HVE22212.1 HlyD family secretion protein [Acidocella sp.]